MYRGEHQPIPELHAGAVHVWWWNLDAGRECLEKLSSLTSGDEQARAGAFEFARHRNRFIVSRGVLRCLLSQYTGIPADALRFCYGQFGKPMLCASHGCGMPHFNLSHSDDLCVCAIDRDREIGIDLERVRANMPLIEMAEQFLSPQETSTLRNLPQHRRPRVFAQWWTQREAYAKALGLGLQIPLDAPHVELRPGAATDGWLMFDSTALTAPSGYVAACTLLGASASTSFHMYVFRPTGVHRAARQLRSVRAHAAPPAP